MFKQTTLIAASAVVIGLVAAPALAQQGKGTEGYVTDTRNAIVMDPFNLCWRTGYWTPAIANCECDKDLLPKQVCEPPPPPAPAAAPPPPPPPPAPAARAEAGHREGHLRGRRVLRLRQVGPEARRQGQARRSRRQAEGHRLEVIIAIGHTDSIGTKDTTRSCRSAVPKP